MTHSNNNGSLTAAAPPSGHLKRTLTSRHLNMIAIGGSIGTGLFVSSGATIAQSGPGGALLAFAVIGLMVYFLMTSLGEMAACMPVSGSFSTYASRYVEESFGFALGWNYWYSWAVTIAVDLVAVQIIMLYWFPDTPGVIWSAAFLVLLFALNVASVRFFGEAEFWFALVKVVTIIIFIAVGVLMLLGILEGGQDGGTHLWQIGDAPIAGGLPALIGVAMIVGFSFQGTEFVGIAAGETANPGRNIPKAVRQIFWRILLFYVLTIVVIGLLIPYTDPRLLKDGLSDVTISPFTLIFTKADMLAAAAVMNAVILTSVVRRQLGHVCLVAHALQPGAGAQGAGHLRPGDPQRHAGLGAAGHRRGRRPVPAELPVQPRQALPVAAEHLRHARFHRLAGHRHQPLPLPPRLPAQWQ